MGGATDANDFVAGTPTALQGDVSRGSLEGVGHRLEQGVVRRAVDGPGPDLDDEGPLPTSPHSRDPGPGVHPDIDEEVVHRLTLTLYSREGVAVLSLREAISRVSAPGELFETREAGAGREFSHAPNSLRELYDAARGDDSPFLLVGDEVWSFDRVMRQADGLSRFLVDERHLVPGDRVGIAMRNCPEWVVSFVAVTGAGLVLVALNPWWSEEEWASALSDARPDVLIVSKDLLDLAQRATATYPHHLIVVGEDAPRSVGVTPYRDVVAHSAPPPEYRPGRSDLATMLFTSGTTGRPKGAISTHGAIGQSLMAFSAGLVIESLRTSENDRPTGLPTTPILLLPLFHVTGLVPVLLSSLAWKFRLVMTRGWHPEEVLELIERHRVTHVVGVPTQTFDLLHSSTLDTTDLSSVARLGGGGAPAPASLVQSVERRLEHGRPFLGYGLTETNAYGPQNYGDDYVARPSSTGQTPTIVMDVEIRDERGEVVPPTRVGEIWVNGPTLSLGYWENEEATRESFVEGWFRTGDLGYRDEEGFLYVVDRVKDMIIRAGENIYCVEVENALETHPLVDRAVVVGLADERLGQRVGALIVTRAADSLREEDLREFAVSHLAHYQVPSQFVLTSDDPPTTATGKVHKDLVRERYF